MNTKIHPLVSSPGRADIVKIGIMEPIIKQSFFVNGMGLLEPLILINHSGYLLTNWAFDIKGQPSFTFDIGKGGAIEGICGYDLDTLRMISLLNFN